MALELELVVHELIAARLGEILHADRAGLVDCELGAYALCIGAAAKRFCE